ncbi:MAG: 5-formyltetrahydrofolate cyclo-ligase, partial [Candidatus Auribacterota bacterium]|nr:5-formyltetrahydrofolate cyclo-ligase [Candidatus Auribacterota bacterium]
MLTKKEIRKRILATRDALPREEIREKSRIIAGRLRELTEYHQAKIIMFYASYGSEVETGNMMETALRDNHRIALPLVKEEENSLEVILIKAPERDISPGFKGIPEPINMPGR